VGALTPGGRQPVDAAAEAGATGRIPGLFGTAAAGIGPCLCGVTAQGRRHAPSAR